MLESSFCFCYIFSFYWKVFSRRKTADWRWILKLSAQSPTWWTIVFALQHTVNYLYSCNKWSEFSIRKSKREFSLHSIKINIADAPSECTRTESHLRDIFHLFWFLWGCFWIDFLSEYLAVLEIMLKYSEMSCTVALKKRQFFFLRKTWIYNFHITMCAAY